MVKGIKSYIFPVKDLAQSKAQYTEFLGIEPHTDQPYYVGFRIGDLDIALDPNGHNNGLTGPVAYWEVDDIKASLQMLIDQGAEVLQDITSFGTPRQIATLKDSNGNLIGLLQE